MSDAYPRRNLGLSENWGRSVEERVAGIARKLGIEIQNLDGLGRYSASSAEEFARNARMIEDALNALPYYFSEATSVASPTVGTSWAPIASITLEVPEGKPVGDIFATATAILPYIGGSSETRFSWPFDLSLVTSEYGPRSGGFHEGIDFAGGAASSGNPIPCAGDGVVAVATTGHPGWGNYVRVTHDVGGIAMSTLYAHMISAPIVSVGQVVSRGQTLGYVGNTGASFGDHLHFETWTDTTYGSHINPREFMDLYGEESTSASQPRLRLRIGGTTSVEFLGFFSDPAPRRLFFFCVQSATVSASDTVTVALEAISGGSGTGTQTTLAVTGAFHA